jgi:hypothetical protein
MTKPPQEWKPSPWRDLSRDELCARVGVLELDNFRLAQKVEFLTEELSAALARENYYRIKHRKEASEVIV